MTVTITDVLATVSNPQVRDLLQDAVREVDARAAAERERVAAEARARESALRIIYSDCAALLPFALQRFATTGEPIGKWEPPAGDGAQFWIKLELPEIEAPLMARFQRRRHVTEGARWLLIDYVLPGILDHNGAITWTFAENHRASCGQDPDVALANLVQLVARSRDLMTVRDA